MICLVVVVLFGYGVVEYFVGFLVDCEDCCVVVGDFCGCFGLFELWCVGEFVDLFDDFLCRCVVGRFGILYVF